MRWPKPFASLPIPENFLRTLSLSEGTAGHVWRSRKPVWSVNLVQDMCFPRSVDAEGAGLHGGVWLAINTDTAVYGVIELLGTQEHLSTSAKTLEEARNRCAAFVPQGD